MSETRRLLLAAEQTFELVLAFMRPFIAAFIAVALVAAMGMINKREVVIPSAFERQPCTEDMPSCWKCKQMGNHQCTEGEVVP